MPMFEIYGHTLYSKNKEIVWEQESIFTCKDFGTWENIIDKFIYFVNRANSIGYYSGYDWCVEIREMGESPLHELYPRNLILRMNKEQYQEYKNIDQYPIRPVFTTHRTFDCYEIRIYQNDVDYDLYFDSNGICPRFIDVWDAWEYIFQHDLIK